MKVGITGHQKLTSEQNQWLREELKLEFKLNSFDEAYSCLAIGTDQIFAKMALDNYVKLAAIIPCKNYEITFDFNGLENYKSILKRAAKIIHLGFDNPSEFAFYEAGKLVVENSDIVIALWNELPSKGLGGTGDIVLFAKSIKKRIVHLNPITRLKKHINYD